MKVNKLLFCLLFLMLGTTTAWADKYYQPGSYKGNTTPRLTPEQAVGRKFMIYNTAIDGNVDRTGFLRNNGVNFELDKSKERDLYVYNESFVYTMEAYDDNADGVNDWYAIKSVTTGLYVNAAGKTDIFKATDAKLYITDWDNATSKSGVNMESWKYNVVANGQITSGGHGSTVFVVKNGNTCWNGNPDAFATYSDGHPFAFYIAHEVTSGDYLQDLHIYSRIDIFSAQQTYGYVQKASQIKSSPVNDATKYPNGYTAEGGFENLIDGVATSYNVTDLENSTDGHYYQIDLGESVGSIYLYMQRRADGLNAPTNYELQASTDGNSYTEIGDYTTELASKAIYTSPQILLNGSYRYLRIVARETTTPNYKCMGLSELYVLPTTKEVADVLGYINAVQSSPLFTKTTAKAYTALVEEYNRLYPDARLLSGVPIPGNKYRIYADTYDRKNQRYVNREIMAEGNRLEVVAPGTYNDASTDDEKKKHEWYCEQTNDGKLVFRNVADPTKYLAYGEVVTEPYKWSINTVLTTHFGVPLMNEKMQYLAVFNDGTYWQGDVKAAQDQHQSYTFTDTTDDVTTTQTIECGVCTDFLFIPVPLDETEKKITITAGELVERNTQLLYDGKVYPLPFSRMFKKTGESWGNLPTLQLLCSNIHSYAGVKINNGETLVTVETTPKVEYNEATSTLSFNFDKIESGDVFDVQLTIKAPFEYSNPDMTAGDQPTLYIIKNMRSQGVQQQARPNRADDANIGIGGDDNDQPISSQTGTYYYAKFDSRNSNMSLVQKDASLDAHSLFYFTQTEDTNTDEYYSTRIHNVTTVMKCASDISWNTNGNTWYVQPNKTYSFIGYNIATTILDATNNPGDTWCSNHADGDRILRYNANDDGSAWEFEPVSVDDAKKLLKEFIDNVANALTKELSGITAEQAAAMGYDMYKIDQYKSIVSQLQSLAEGYYNAENIAKLVQYAQNIHMIEHEIDYALYALPELTDENGFNNRDFTNPHWYYVKNVNSDERYATYSGDETPMTLGQKADGKLALSNLFYFVGEKNTYATEGYEDFPGNNLIIDDYLKAHIHNFMAKGKTLVSKNVELTKETGITPGKGEQEVAKVNLKGDEDWSLELEYDLAPDFQAYNAYGSCLLASTNPLQDNYSQHFQIYLKDDRSLVIKVNNAHDTYRFWHTQDHFTHIKVVITYSQGDVTLDVYNSLGEKETIPVENVTLTDISTLYSGMPGTGATISNLATYQVEAMTWKEHADASDKDEWYILTSSNLNKTGMAIVLGEPNDTKMAWTNKQGKNEDIATDLGIYDNSTWKFERVTDFRAHLAELLAMYDFKDCVIYDRELAALMRLIMEKSEVINANADDSAEEAAFNEVYYAILNYTGRMPEQLMAPNPGFLYTIRPAVEEFTENALLVHVDEKGNGTYSTKELFNGDVMRDDKSYDSRAAWVFEGADGSTLTGLKAKNIHTQCYMTALGADASAVNEQGAATVTLAPLGACTTMFQVGDKYMNRTSSTGPVVYGKHSGFWGNAVTEYPADIATVFESVTGHNAVHCKSLYVNVDAEAAVTVTFTHKTGSDKLNMLGVTLVNGNGDIVAGRYHHGKAGGSHVDNEYSLGNVAPGVYTLNLYVANLVHSDADYNDKVYNSGGEVSITGISQIAGESKILSTGAATTKWIVEEIRNPETSVYYETTIEEGYSTLMLGFDAQIPDGVEAYTGAIDGIVVDKKYLSMTQYEGSILAANTPVVLRSSDEGVAKIAQFYFSTIAGEPEEDNYLRGSLYHTVVSTAKIEDAVGASINIYMLQSGKSGPKMYWIYEEYDADGDLVDEYGNKDPNGGSNDAGKHVLCKANKAYIVIKSGEANGKGSFMFMLNRGGATGIDDVEGETEEVETIYDLQGRRLQEITHPGVYIVNGRKVMVK